MQSVLEIDSVVKCFDGRQVLTDIYLKCETGDVLGMLGRNGSGKSTLLKILFGVLGAENKFIRIDGKVYTTPYQSRDELCYLPQEPFLPKQMILERAVVLYLGKGAIGGFFSDPILEHYGKSKVAHLSGGLQRYMEIKLLLSTNCKFLLLDEPFSGVSPLLVESIKRLITEASSSKGILLTDHDYRNVLDVATRHCLIVDGGIKEIRDSSELVRWGYLRENRMEPELV